MRLEEFRKHKWLCPQWRRELQSNGIVQALLEMLQDEHPARFSAPTDINDDLSPTKATLLLGETKGYSRALNNILAAARPLIAAQAMPEPTYAKPIPEEEIHA